MTAMTASKSIICLPQSCCVYFNKAAAAVRPRLMFECWLTVAELGTSYIDEL